MPQKSDNKTVRIFSARACAAPLEKAAKLFEEETGISVAIDVCSRGLASHPDSEPLKTLHLVLLLQSGRAGEAESILNDWISERPHEPEQYSEGPVVESAP